MPTDPDDEDYYEDEADELGDQGEVLGRRLEDHFVGDDRFAAVELLGPGPEEGEDFRLQLSIDDQTSYFIALRGEESVARVGMVTQDEAVGRAIEAAIHDAGESITEFLEAALDPGEALDYEIQHYAEDGFHLWADIPFDSPARLQARSFIEQLVYYVDAFVETFARYLAGGD
jgi:hypothetical protein